MAGTKKRKMDISKAIVEATYSLDPPGRFLKQCPDTGLAEKKVSEPQLYPRLSIDAVCRTNVRISSFKDCLHGRHQETKDGHIQGYR